MAKFYITTPIYYSNDVAHIGHAYTNIATDVLARYHRLQGDEVLFSTGTDEHSQKVVKSAEAAGEEIHGYVDSMATRWQQTWDQLDIQYDRFIRTSEPAHQTAVYAVLERLQQAGDIYQGEYEGLYCAGCEEFKKESDLVNGKCPEHDRAPERVKEKNYFFKLSKYQNQLQDYLNDHPEFVQPESRRHEVQAFVKRGLEDISITRETQKWGIPYPFDQTQVIYVWAEALMNYLTVAAYPDGTFEKWWPADVHMVGKGIIKFHCIIWPAMLMSAGLALPKTVFAHGHLNVGGTKISKSLGNAIDPIELAKRYGVDGLRYLLLRNTTFGQDGEFSLDQLTTQYNADLANDLGNLVQRVAAMIMQYQNGQLGEVPAHSHDVEPYHAAMRSFRFDQALEEVWLLIRGLNQYIEEEKPWKVAKAGDAEQLKETLAYLASNIIQIGSLLEPFMPQTAKRISATFAGGSVHTEVGVLFPKIEAESA